MINCPRSCRDDKCFRDSGEGAICPRVAEETDMGGGKLVSFRGGTMELS